MILNNQGSMPLDPDTFRDGVLARASAEDEYRETTP
jgi:hypothetical protein